MHDSPYRLAVAVLLLAGFSTLALSLGAAAGLPLAGSPDPVFAPLAWHRHLLASMIGAGLVIAVFVPGLRFAAVAAAILDKASFTAVSLAAGSRLEIPQWVDAVVLVALVAAVTVLARRARQEARWEGMLPLRREA